MLGCSTASATYWDKFLLARLSIRASRRALKQGAEMRCLVLSDLHREIWRENAPPIHPLINRPDVVILAGDIDKGSRAVAWAAETFEDLPVLYVAGNHEAYGMTLEDAEAEIKQATLQHMNVHFLNCDELVIGDVRFLGCTLWTNFCLFGDRKRWSAMIDAREAMNDYQRIRRRSDYRKLHPSDTARLHAQHKTWLRHRLQQPTTARATVVITHMAPSMLSVAAEYADDPVSAAFASNLDDLVEMCDLYVHGHMHKCFDYRIGRARVICNPCGYPLKDGSAENADFNPNLIIEV
jgi:predicted phosphodiesterase